jgi:hypothetical protein
VGMWATRSVVQAEVGRSPQTYWGELSTGAACPQGFPQVAFFSFDVFPMSAGFKQGSVIRPPSR